MITLPWFEPATIDGTPRRALFERVPEAKPAHLLEWTYAIMYPQMNADLCRAAVDRWARGADLSSFLTESAASLRSELLHEPDDDKACEMAHGLADWLGIDQ